MMFVPKFPADSIRNFYDPFLVTFFQGFSRKNIKIKDIFMAHSHAVTVSPHLLQYQLFLLHPGPSGRFQLFKSIGFPCRKNSSCCCLRIFFPEVLITFRIRLPQKQRHHPLSCCQLRKSVFSFSALRKLYPKLLIIIQKPTNIIDRSKHFINRRRIKKIFHCAKLYGFSCVIKFSV